MNDFEKGFLWGLLTMVAVIGIIKLIYML